MRTLSESRFLRYVTFTALYFAQGLPWGFISVGYVVFLADQGLDNTAVGSAIGLAYVPWSFKILAGPLLDRIRDTRWGRRRPFIIGAELLMGLTLLGLLAVDPVKQLQAVGIILFLHNCGAALQDVAVDAMAVDLLPEDQRGKANSFMWAGKSAGIALAGGGGTVLARYFGWPTLFVLLALAVWAVMAVPILLRERPVGEAPRDTGRLDLHTLKVSFGFSTPWFALLIAVLTPVGYAMVGTVYTRLLRADLKLDAEHIGFLSGVIDPLSGVAGALIGGTLADRLGARRTMGGFMVAIAACMATFGLSSHLWPHFWFLVAYGTLFGLCVSAYSAASLGYFMGMSNPAIGATQFAAYMAATNFTYAWTSPAGGRIADAYGYTTLFLTAAIVQVVAISLLPLANPARAAERYRVVGALPPTERAPAG